ARAPEAESPGLGVHGALSGGPVGQGSWRQDFTVGAVLLGESQAVAGQQDGQCDKRSCSHGVTAVSSSVNPAGPSSGKEPLPPTRAVRLTLFADGVIWEDSWRSGSGAAGFCLNCPCPAPPRRRSSPDAAAACPSSTTHSAPPRRPAAT